MRYMLAIPPNRQSVPDELQTRCRTRSLVQSMRIIATLAVLVGVSQTSWSDSTSSGAVYAPAEENSKQCSANDLQSQLNAIRFLAAKPAAVAPKAAVPQQPSPVATKPISTPPLALADYKNYITG